MKDPIFEPILINSLKVKNRIFMPAMHLNMAENFLVTDKLIGFYAKRAIGGAGMISCGYATVDDLSGSSLNIGAHKDEFIPGLKRLAEAITQNGARAALQLNHSGRYNFSFFLNGKKPVAPSPIASRLTKETPQELEHDQILEIINSFAEAALRVKKAGFDAVEILSGTGYLISEFLSPLTNHRKDEYGGDLKNRMKFGLDIMKAIKKATGDDYPLIVRINGNEFMPGGSTSKDLQEYAKALVNAGVDALCINVGWHEAKIPQIVTEVPRGVYAYLAKNIKDIVNVPVIASHRINDPQIAREILSDGMCDMVAMGRSLIADPYLPEKAKKGRDDEIVHCIACAQGCFDHLFQLKSVQCLCNPIAGFENERKIEKSSNTKKVMIIGGGPAGMNAAIAASDRGHDVTIFEKDDKLGGQLFIAGAPPGRDEFQVLARDLSRQVSKRKIKTVLNQFVDEKIISLEKPDAIILATGAKPIQPNIEGVDQDHVVQAWDVLSGKVICGKKVVIIGGGAVGVETALYLSEKGTLSADAVKFLLVNKAETPEDIYEMATKGVKQITLIEMINKVGKDIGKSTRWAMLQDISRRNINIKVASKAKKITENAVQIESGNDLIEIEADTVVLGVGSVSNNSLIEIIEKFNIPYDIIGDANKVAKAFDAVHDGFLTGMKI